MAVPFKQITDRAHSAARWRDEALPKDGRWGTLVEVWRSAKRHRTTGHAAEMAFFAVLTLVPSTIAVGSALGLSERLVSAGVVDKAEQAASDAVRVLMGPQLADNVITPFVHAQLTQPHRDVALGALLIAWWLSSHLFNATGHALDSAYGVTDRRATVVQRFIALAFGLVSVLIVSLTVELMVNGPLGRGGGFTRDMGLDRVYAVGWSAFRWPLLLGIVIGFLACLYRFSANVRHCWRDCLPGAVIGAALWICAAVAFRVSAALGLSGSGGVAADDPAVQIIGQSVNAVVATVLWAYLASIAILIGGEFNAILRTQRAGETIEADEAAAMAEAMKAAAMAEAADAAPVPAAEAATVPAALPGQPAISRNGSTVSASPADLSSRNRFTRAKRSASPDA
jgi:membrane protein